MNCRTTAAVNFRTKLGFRQHDPILTQEQSNLKKRTMKKLLLDSCTNAAFSYDNILYQ